MPVIQAALETQGLASSLGISFGDIRRATGKLTRGVFEAAGMPTIGGVVAGVGDAVQKAVSRALGGAKDSVVSDAASWASDVGQRLIDMLPLSARAKTGAYAMSPFILPAALAAGALYTKGAARLGLGAAAVGVYLLGGKR